MKDKSILLMGNGGSLIDSGLGPKIDEFDEVIRMNEAKIIGFEEDVGNKFTIWCTYNPEQKFNKFVKGYKNKGFTLEEIKDIVKKVKEIWYVAPRIDLLHKWRSKDIIDLGLDDRIKRHESVREMRSISRKTGIPHPTTGFILINILLQMYDKIYITGFDFLGYSPIKVKYHHYWKNQPVEKGAVTVVHKFKEEYEYVRKLIDEGKVEFLDKSTDIRKSKFIGIYRILDNCKNCNHSISLYNWEQPLCHYCENLL